MSSRIEALRAAIQSAKDWPTNVSCEARFFVNDEEHEHTSTADHVTSSLDEVRKKGG